MGEGTTLSGEGRHEFVLDTALLARSHTEQSGAVAVFPRLSFSCSGVIHRVFLVGREGEGTAAPNLTIWQSGVLDLLPQLRHTLPLNDLRRVLHDSATGVGLYEQQVETQFVRGDVIGFTQSEDRSVVLRYMEGTGETLVVDEDPHYLPILPLIGLETSEHSSLVVPSSTVCV